ncbi:hypothetical protein DNTS_035668 [Danionella cerebrum]|uniref:Uncharacterized protein n=1 Tax=Danionella cerebrum TaxID=2873325 RepID=A0A553QMV8_9TELE|nr:hypothetical protein DNTS_035668 [Danionella translucida]
MDCSLPLAAVLSGLHFSGILAPVTQGIPGIESISTRRAARVTQHNYDDLELGVGVLINPLSVEDRSGAGVLFHNKSPSLHRFSWPLRRYKSVEAISGSRSGYIENILLFCSLVLVLVEGDLEAGSQAMFSTDPDSTSDEAPTESMNLISPDLHTDELLYYNGATADTSSTSSEVGNSDAAKSSMEENDEDESADSEEAPSPAVAVVVVKPAPVPVQRATKSHNPSAARKRSKPSSSSKKRSRNSRP